MERRQVSNISPFFRHCTLISLHLLDLTQPVLDLTPCCFVSCIDLIYQGAVGERQGLAFGCTEEDRSCDGRRESDLWWWIQVRNAINDWLEMPLMTD